MQTPNELLPDGLQMELLWTNASPRATFVEQNIFIDLSKYKAIVVEVCEYAGTDSRSVDMYSGLFVKGFVGCIVTFMMSNSATMSFVRRFYMIDDSIWISNAADTNYTNNLGAVPQRMYGVK